MSIDRLPPQSIEAEQSVLGALLIDRDAVIEVADFLRPQDFYRQANATVYEANMAQTAGTAAGEIGFMCIVLAAIDMLNDRPALGFSLHLSGTQIFLWLTFAGLLGAFLAVPLRRHYMPLSYSFHP